MKSDEILADLIVNGLTIECEYCPVCPKDALDDCRCVTDGDCEIALVDWARKKASESKELTGQGSIRRTPNEENRRRNIIDSNKE